MEKSNSLLFSLFIKLRVSEAITANVGTEGANEKFPFWELFRRADRFPHISMSFDPITSKPIPIFRNNSCAISDVVEIAEMYFILPFGT